MAKLKLKYKCTHLTRLIRILIELIIIFQLFQFHNKRKTYRFHVLCNGVHAHLLPFEKAFSRFEFALAGNWPRTLMHVGTIWIEQLKVFIHKLSGIETALHLHEGDNTSFAKVFIREPMVFGFLANYLLVCPHARVFVKCFLKHVFLHLRQAFSSTTASQKRDDKHVTEGQKSMPGFLVLRRDLLLQFCVFMAGFFAFHDFRQNCQKFLNVQQRSRMKGLVMLGIPAAFGLDLFFQETFVKQLKNREELDYYNTQPFVE